VRPADDEREGRDALQHLTETYVDAKGGVRPARSASPFRAYASLPNAKPIPCPQLSERIPLM
jgi:hypothetical protein